MNKIPLTALVVGCGRSGTGFLADAICKAGTPCSHEGVFDVNGINWAAKSYYESSWYAVPYMEQISKQCRILHIVRNPLDVMRSFYRIGLFSKTPLRHITYGNGPKYFASNLGKPKKIYERTNFALKHRRYLNRYTNIFDEKDEINRLELYWLIWNIKIQKFSELNNSPYMRIRLEDIAGQEEEISNFLGVQLDFSVETFRNKKMNYKHRILGNHKLKDATLVKAREFGYEHHLMM